MAKYTATGAQYMALDAASAGGASANPAYTQMVNGSATVITAVAATANQTSADLINPNARGVKVVLDMTTVGTGSVTLTIKFKDVASGKYIALLTGVAITTVSTNVYTVYPGLTAAANAVASDTLSGTWQVLVTANNANPTTYTVGANLLF